MDVDFMDENYNTAHSASYEGVSPARVLSGITSFYDEGIKPKGNVSYSVARLPKAEYAKLSSEIMTRQHTYHRPPFDYAYTSGKFYVYDYLGDGDFIIKFALPIVEEYKEAISLISKAIDNGTINSTRNLDTFLETTRSGKGDDIIDLVDVLKERAWYQGVSTPMSSRQGRKARGVSNVGNSDSTTTPSRGTNRRGASLENSTKDSYSLNRNDIDYLDATNRVDAERRDIERKAKADGTWLKAPNGKDTNLSPEQWVTVRTKAFKKWFGDWELAYKKDFLLNGKEVSTLTGEEFKKVEGKTLTEQVGEYFNSIGGKAYSPIYGEVILNEDGAEDSFAHGIGRTKAIAYAAVKDVIEQGVIVDYDANHKDREYDSVVISAPIEIAGDRWICSVVITRRADNRFYLHEVIEQKRLSSEGSNTVQGQPQRPSGLPRGALQLRGRCRRVEGRRRGRQRILRRVQPRPEGTRPCRAVPERAGHPRGRLHRARPVGA